MQQTFAQFRTEVLTETYPIGVPDNLLTSVNGYFPDTLIDLQRWVKCLQQHNTNVVSACNTYYDCGLTVVDAPKGRINRVYTIANGDWCDQVTYTQVTYAQVRAGTSLLIIDNVPPAQPQRPPLPMGVLYADAVSDDLVQSRARRGDFAIHRGRLYLLPWLQSNEQLVIEWEGIKTEWSDDDIVDYDRPTKLAVQHSVRAKYYGDFTQDNANYVKYNALYENQRADLIYECRQETQVVANEFVERILPTGLQIRDDAP